MKKVSENLKRCIETIISKINIHVLSDGDNDIFPNRKNSFTITLNEKHIEILLKSETTNSKPPFGMYL